MPSTRAPVPLVLEADDRSESRRFAHTGGVIAPGHRATA